MKKEVGDARYKARLKKRKESGIELYIHVEGAIFDAENNSEWNIAPVEENMKNVIIDAVLTALSDKQAGFFIEGKSIAFFETDLMQDPDYDRGFAVKIDDNIYPITVNMTVEVNHANLLNYTSLL